MLFRFGGVRLNHNELKDIHLIYKNFNVPVCLPPTSLRLRTIRLDRHCGGRLCRFDSQPYLPHRLCFDAPGHSAGKAAWVVQQANHVDGLPAEHGDFHVRRRIGFNGALLPETAADHVGNEGGMTVVVPVLLYSLTYRSKRLTYALSTIFLSSTVDAFWVLSRTAKHNNIQGSG